MACMKYSFRPLPACLLLTGMTFNSLTHASGIYLDTQNGAGTGNVFAGAAAIAEDASTVFFNPAGMSRLGAGHHTSVAGSIVSIDSSYKDRGTTPLAPDVPVGASHSVIHRDAAVPSLFYAGEIGHGFHIGMGISPLFANEGSWPGRFAGRYQGSDTKVHVIDYNPSLSYRVNDTLSLGFGLNYLDIDASLSRATKGLFVDGTYMGDGQLTIEGKDKGWGYNAGALWQFSPAGRLGVSYRKTTSLEIEGNSIRATPGVQEIVLPGKAKIDVPQMFSVALAYQWNQWEFVDDITWSKWSVVPGIYVYERDTNFLLFSEQLNFRDGWRAGSGANYKYNDKLKLRLGIAYDRSVVPNPSSRTVRFPDNNRKWIGAGCQYQITANDTIDAGYAHVFVSDTNIDRRTEYDTPTSQEVHGDIHTQGDIFSLQWNHNW